MASTHVAYTTQAAVLTHLPVDPDATTVAKIDEWIKEASDFADGFLHPYSVPLAAITASPPTPAAVEMAVRYLVVDRALQDLRLGRYEDQADGTRLTWEDKGLAILNKIQDGRILLRGLL